MIPHSDMDKSVYPSTHTYIRPHIYTHTHASTHPHIHTSIHPYIHTHLLEHVHVLALARLLGDHVTQKRRKLVRRLAHINVSAPQHSALEVGVGGRIAAVRGLLDLVGMRGCINGCVQGCLRSCVVDGRMYMYVPHSTVR
jgi:hypothetical protein